MIRPLREDEYEAWLEASRAEYARGIEEDGGVPSEDAQRKAVDDFVSTLPDGLATEGHAIFTFEAEGTPEGWLWVAERPGMSGRQLFVYELRVDPAHRGRGRGRALMLFAEEEARRRSLPRVALNVFGGNEVARNLYRSLGYNESAVFMVKELG